MLVFWVSKIIYSGDAPSLAPPFSSYPSPISLFTVDKVRELVRAWIDLLADFPCSLLLNVESRARTNSLSLFSLTKGPTF